MNRIPASSWIWLLLALGSVVLVHRDPWRTAIESPTFVSSRSAAVRLFPDLPEGVPTDVVLEISGPEGLRARIEPGPRGPLVHGADELLGPADPEAVDGLWASLRAATTLRAVPTDTDAGLGERGRIAMQWGETRIEIVLGRPSPDGAGLYGAIVGEGGDTSEVWVVERELGDIVDQGADAWAARRPLVADPAEIAEIEFADAKLVRGPDGLWRSTVGESVAIVQREAVEARLGRLLAARLDPWLPTPYARDDAPPWMRVTTLDGTSLGLWLRGACPQMPERVVIDRGEGRPGCVDARVVEPWPLPGREGGRAWIERRLLPHAYGRVLSIEQVRPRPQTLRRQGGTWMIEADGGVIELRETEVYRWYEAMFEARLDLEAKATGSTDDVELVITTDTTASLRLRCGRADDERRRTCRRDDEPLARVRIAVDPAFTAETFADRRLVELEPGQARAIEITGRDVVRQSAQLDLGVWRLDAPLHPEGDVALDELRLEELLGTLGAARAQSWTAVPSGDPDRVLRVERAAIRGQSAAIELQVWEGCIARVGQGRAARIDDGTCATLGRDLLGDAPLQHVIDEARELVLVEGGAAEIRLRRADGRLVREDGEPLGREREQLVAWSQLRAQRLRPGDPGTPHVATLAVVPTVGEPYTLEIGDGWARVAGQGWFYVLAPDEGAPAADEGDGGELPGDGSTG